MDEYLDAAEDDMKAAVDHLGRELLKVRTGRATPKLLDSVVVEVQSYGASMPLNQLATIQAADARLLTVTPWDKSTISDIERGIIAAGLGLNPSNDGQIVRVPVPALTADRRSQLVRTVKQLGEDAKVAIRHVRREYNDTFRDAQKDGDISEDDLHRYLGRIQDLTDAYVKRSDDAVDAKEQEVLEV
ncbi:MAG: ribosome recycling factor [Alphaproteobacteria bacterium]|nr:ribosome recycling factor [Alphaproteobacteria bacterium]